MANSDFEFAFRAFLKTLPVAYCDGDPLRSYLHGWSLRDFVQLCERRISPEQVQHALHRATEHVWGLPDRTFPKGAWTIQDTQSYTLSPRPSGRPAWRSTSSRRAGEDLHLLLTCAASTSGSPGDLRNAWLLALAAAVMRHDGRSKAAKIGDAREGIRPPSPAAIAEELIRGT